jgi:hypothetical protein
LPEKKLYYNQIFNKVNVIVVLWTNGKKIRNDLEIMSMNLELFIDRGRLSVSIDSEIIIISKSTIVM